MKKARMVKLVYTLRSGRSSGLRSASSSLAPGTIVNNIKYNNNGSSFKEKMELIE